ncbi:alpha/beta fold hydrolase [Pseudoduganella violacea]|uniref:Pimeloyl-ACP methyl ester carboxylesterase n=1 Tax=Pseudoduganella violacea TaxID=1715466 RepID=A0A7W5B7M5_9BURK|nr:alpha/beta hydrolase [Pseudoduganella violacea]MBB3117330.1 pimeloyl-ACP methyl ester carboxylesterase [Pseudoduganella violacea]
MNRSIRTALFASTLLAGASLIPAHAAASDTTVVLVHGAFADGSSWQKVIPLLQAKGVKVVAVQNPLSSLADDAAVTRRVIEAQSGKVVLVGHSWGGAVISEAGASDKVKALVYVAAFAPQVGEAVGALGKEHGVSVGVATLQADSAGYLSLPAASVAANFAQDVSAAEQRLIAATQGPINSKAFGEPLSTAAWTAKPSYYIVASKDRMIQPALQQDFAKRMQAKVTTLASSHVPMLSQPKQVAEVILAALQQP